MEKKSKKLRKSIFLLLFLVVMLVPHHGSIAYAQEQLSAPKDVHAKRQSNTSIQVQWKKSRQARGYEVYRYDSNKKTYRLKKRLKRNQKIRWIDKKIKKNKTYKYKVRAIGKNGKKGEFSYSVSTRSYARWESGVNAGKIVLKKTDTNMNITSATYLTATVYPSNYSNSHYKKILSKKVRWYSSNTKIVRVTAKGKVIAGKTPGSCRIYAVAHNGVKKSVKVTVKNYAILRHPDTDDIPEPIKELLTKRGDEIGQIATYFTLHPMAWWEDGFSIYLDDNDKLVNESGKSFGEMDQVIENLLRTLPYDLKIEVWNGGVNFSVRELIDVDDNEKETYETYVLSYEKGRKHLGGSDKTDIEYEEVAPYWGYLLGMMPGPSRG